MFDLPYFRGSEEAKAAGLLGVLDEEGNLAVAAEEGIDAAG